MKKLLLIIALCFNTFSMAITNNPAQLVTGGLLAVSCSGHIMQGIAILKKIAATEEKKSPESNQKRDFDEFIKHHKRQQLKIGIMKVAGGASLIGLTGYLCL